MYQPYPSSGQPVEPLRPPAPAPVRTAVKLMHAGAAVGTLSLIIALPVLGDIKSYHQRWNGPSLTAAQLSRVRPWRPRVDRPTRSSWSIADRSIP
jgi:hypothetical protein